MGKISKQKKLHVYRHVFNVPGLLVCAMFFLIIFFLFGGVWVCSCFGQWGETPGLQENFDSDQPSWEMLYIDSGGKFTERARVSDSALSGNSETYQCKFIEHGVYFVGHQVHLPYLIEDLNTGIWVHSQETGVICALEVVLPKSTTQDGKLVTLLLPGDKYTNCGEWQQLRVKADLRELEQQAKSLRIELGVPIDTSQAYVRRLILCCYASGKNSKIWIDQLNVSGIATISRQLRDVCETEPTFNPKNVLWLYRKIGLYCDITLGLSAHVEATAVAGENWTVSQSTTPQPTIGRHTPPAQRLVPPDVLEQTRNIQQQYSSAGFDPKLHSQNLSHTQSLLIPDHPIMMVAGDDDAQTIWPHTAEYQENNITAYPQENVTPDATLGGGRTTILPSDQAISTASFEQQRLTPLSSSPLSSRLSDQPGLFRRENEGEFPEHVLQDRINRGKPHDGCRITAQRDTLWINENLPYAVRAIEYRGESLAFLAGLQFNTIWLRQVPTEQLLEEAWQLGLWLICPPPDSEILQRFVNTRDSVSMGESGTNNANGFGVVNRMFAQNRNPILAWDLGRNLTLGEAERVRQYIQLLRQADLYRDIPSICSIESGTRDYSYMVDIVLLERNPILSSLEMNNYNSWLATKAAWARVGTPNWCSIQTQPTAMMANQWQLFGVNEIPPMAVSEEHVRMQIRMAMANQCHGLLFTSNSRLDTEDAKYRAALLELVNMELMLIEGWLSASNSSQTIRSNVDGVNGILLTTDRARLLLAGISKPLGQYVMGNTNCNNVDFLMPGSFETHQANYIMPGGTRPLTLQRITGGVHVHFDEVNTTTSAFFAQADPVLRAVIPRSRQPELSQRSARLSIELAKMRLEQVRKTIRAFQEIRALPGGLPYITMSEQESMLRETEGSIGTAESHFQQADYSSAYQQAQRSIAGLQYYERFKWEEATRTLPQHNMIPTAVSFGTLPAYISMIKRMYSMKVGENRLATGDGENAAQWQQAGWRSLQLPTEGVTPVVTVANSRAARSGQGGIQLQLLTTNQLASTTPGMGTTTGVSTTLPLETPSDNDIVQLETAPIWITTPQIPVYAGEILCITGYIKIPQKLQGNVDRLMIFDSLGGESLALRLSETNGQWQQFFCYRAVPDIVPPQASMCVTFALSSVGEVWLDDVQIFPVIHDPNAPTTPQPSPSTPNWQLPRIDQMFFRGE